MCVCESACRRAFVVVDCRVRTWKRDKFTTTCMLLIVVAVHVVVVAIAYFPSLCVKNDFHIPISKFLHMFMRFICMRVCGYMCGRQQQPRR